MNHFNLRIYNTNKTDYIDLYTNKLEGNITDFKSFFKRITKIWESVQSQVEVDLINTNFDFRDIHEWLELLENTNKVNSFFPSIHSFASLLCSSDLTGFRVFPSYTTDSASLCESLFYDSPDISCTLNQKSISFSSNIKKKKINYVEVDKFEYSILRISSRTYSDKYVYTDLKIRKYDKDFFLEAILSLPEFWRNFHFTTRNQDCLDSNSPINKINQILTHFYVSNKRNKNKPQNKDEVFEYIKSLPILDLTISTFANHLMFRLPGLIQPLTKGEQLWSDKYKPDIELTINENEVNLISLPYSSNHSDNKDFLKNFSNEFSNRELSFANHFELPKYSGGKFLITTTEHFAYIYESNLVEVFDSLTKMQDQRNK